MFILQLLILLYQKILESSLQTILLWKITLMMENLTQIKNGIVINIKLIAKNQEQISNAKQIVFEVLVNVLVKMVNDWKYYWWLSSYIWQKYLSTKLIVTKTISRRIFSIKTIETNFYKNRYTVKWKFSILLVNLL